MKHFFIYGFLIFMICWSKPVECITKKDLVRIDIRNARVLTSPLQSGINSTDFLHYDFSSSPVCTLTKSDDNIHSWIVVDLSFVIHSIAEFRFYGDAYHQNSHLLLSNIEIYVTNRNPFVSPTNYSDIIYFSKDRNLDEFCGKTGMVSQYTYDVVVSCDKSITARWIVLRRLGQINICHLRIFQSELNPQCYQKITKSSDVLNIINYAKVYRSIRHISILRCQQNCAIAQWNCEGLVYVPMTYGTGICQLLKISPQKYQYKHLFCDVENSCNLIINICHLGKNLYIGNALSDKIISLPTYVQSNINNTLISLEISGKIECSQQNCGSIKIYVSKNADIKNSNQRKLVECANIISNLYRILDKHVFLCSPVISNAMDVVIRSDNAQYEFNKIMIRLIDNEIQNFILKISQQTFTTKPDDLNQVTTISTRFTSDSTISSTKTFLKIDESSTSLKSTQYISSSVIPKHSPSSSTLSPTLSKSSVISTLSPTLSKSSVISTSSIQSKSPLNHSKKSSVTLIKTEISQSTKRKSTLPSYFQNKELQNDRESNSTLDFNKFDISIAGSDKYSFLWIILLVFFLIFIFVTAVGLIVSSLQSRKKRKEWDLPDGGLCPPNELHNLEYLDQTSPLVNQDTNKY